MVCLGFEPTAAGWKAQMKPRSYTFVFFYFQLTDKEASSRTKLFGILDKISNGNKSLLLIFVTVICYS